MKRVTRREALGTIAATGLAATTTFCGERPRGKEAAVTQPTTVQGGQAQATTAPAAPAADAPVVDVVKGTKKLGFRWETADPFLFCVHHDDKYPEGNGRFGPAASLAGRSIGQDFEGIDGWRMYHGDVVPGFPQHPHRGFETVTVVRKGLLDHSDSLGAAARYGHGDVQWLTAGQGISHAEMFPLLDQDKPNPVELFQIWLNLPAAKKMSKPHFTMLWSGLIPNVEVKDAAGKTTRVTVIAGRYGDAEAASPPPDSYASAPGSDVAIMTIKMEPGARFVLPAAPAGVNRNLYFFEGPELKVGGRALPASTQAELRPDADAVLEAGRGEVEALLLQGRPIGEPVAWHGPFVMNNRQELQQAYADYRATRFGGWPWPQDDPVHGPEPKRFARHADGRIDKPA